MAYDSLKALIRQYIKTNGEQEITGQILQNVLVEMVNQYPSTDGFATQSWVTSQGYATTSQLAGYLPLTGGTLTGALMTSGTTQGIQLRAYFDNDTIAIQKYENNDWVSVCSLSGPGYITGSTYHGNQYIVNNGTSSQFLKADGSLDSNTYITASALTGYATQSWVTTQLSSYLPLTGGTLTGALMTSGTTIGIQLRAYFDNDTIAIQRFENNDWVSVCSLSGTGYITGTTYHGNQYIVNNGTSSQFLKADGSVDSNTYITASALTGYATQSWVTTQLGSYLPLTGGTLTGALMTSGTTQGIQLRAYFDNDTIAIQRFENNDWVNVCSLSGTGYITGATYHGNQYIVNNGTSDQFLKADGSVDSTVYLPKQGNSFYFITDADMPETASNIASLNAAHRMTLYRNAILMPYMANDANDGGFIRSRGTSESSAIMEIGMWDDAGAGETIQFNYYPTTSTINPTYSVTVPKKTGTIALTSDLASYNPTTNFKTINNQSIIGTGNINIEGGGGGSYYDAEIEYLESTGTQWIDTGIPDSWANLIVTLDILVQKVSDAQQDYFGSFRGGVNFNYAGYFPNLSNNFVFQIGLPYVLYGENDELRHTHIYDAISKTASLDTNTVTASNLLWYDASVYTFKLFQKPEGSNITRTSHNRLYGAKFERNGVLIRDFIPVRVGQVGYLYDKVSGQLFGNNGSGSFVLGADKEYLPLTGGTITGNLTVKGTLTASDGYLNIYSVASNHNTIFEFTDSQDVIFSDGGEYFFYAQINAPGFVNTSDLRKKTITGDVPMNLYNVANAPLFKFTWNNEKKYSGQHIGSAAQYWQTVLPELVSIGRDADMTLAMQYDVIALASAITVAKTVVNHEERIILLERENEALKKEIANLKSA